MKRTERLNVGRETLISLVSKFGMAAVSFGGVVVFARVLGPDGLGVYRTALAAGVALSSIPSGIGQAIKKRVSEVDVAPGRFLGTGLLLHLGASAAMLAAFLLAAPVTVPYFGSEGLALSVVAVFAALGAFQVTNQLYSGIGYPGLATTVDGARSAFVLAVQFVLLYLGMEAFGLAVGMAVGTAAAAGVSLLAAGVVPTPPTRAAFSRVSDFARWSVPTAMMDNLYANADVLILRTVAGNGPVGIYTTALQVSVPAAYIAGSIEDALEVKSSGLSSRGSEVRADLVNGVAYAGLFSIPAFFGALAIPEAIMRTVFGTDFAAGWPALVGMTLFQAFNSFRKPFAATVSGTDRPRLRFRVSLATVAVHLPGAVLLGLEYGLVGVVAATVVAEALRVALYQYVAHTTFDGVVLPRPVLDQLAAAALMFLSVRFVVRPLVPITAWYWLGLVVGVAVALYFGILLAVSTHFRRTMRATLPDGLVRWPVR
jgi:O-antigen/teichoic acid export membrane protein